MHLRGMGFGHTARIVEDAFLLACGDISILIFFLFAATRRFYTEGGRLPWQCTTGASVGLMNESNVAATRAFLALCK